MENFDFVVENVRYHIYDENKVVFFGWFRDDNPDKREIKVYVDGKPVEVKYSTQRGIEIRQKYLLRNAGVTEEVQGEFELDHGDIKSIEFYSVLNGKERSCLKLKGDNLSRLKDEVQGYVERKMYEDGIVKIIGWALAGDEVQFELYAEGEKLDISVERGFRRDVHAAFPEIGDDVNPGYTLTAKLPKWKKLELIIRSGDAKTVERINDPDKNEIRNPFVKTVRWMKAYGLKVTWRRIVAELTGKGFSLNGDLTKVNYDDWRKKYEITDEDIEAMKQVSFDYNPKLSIVIPLYDTKIAFLRELLDSFENQIYTNWELCLADGTGEGSPLEAVIREYMDNDDRIKYEILADNKGISENTNAAIKMATGEYIVLSDHDDIVPVHALFECVKALNEDKTIDVIYSDEDKVDMDGKKFFDPHFKSDFNIDLLCSMNYICHLFVVKKSLVDEVGMLRSEFDGAQDHDFILRCCEKAENIKHIPKILYHWRCHMDSTAANPESKMYAFEAGRKAVQEHYNRIGVPAKVEHGQFYGMYKTVYEWEEQPLISIIIPTKDHIDDLQKCINSIEEKSSYRNFELVIVENNSTEQETFDYYKSIEGRDNVQVLYYKGDFNFSKINNFGVEHAKGDYILLLNNDTEIINPDCLKEMLGYCMREDVGIVGARLYYPDNTIQHAGVVLGFGGMAGHTFIGCSRYDNGYFSRIICAQDYSAVTAACMMTKKSIYEEVGGLTEEFKVAFNDIDFCMKVRDKGYLIVYNPAVELYHYESKSRGLEDTDEKVERFNSEVNRFLERWDKQLKAGDPYYNVNLSLNRSDFGLRE